MPPPPLSTHCCLPLTTCQPPHPAPHLCVPNAIKMNNVQELEDINHLYRHTLKSSMDFLLNDKSPLCATQLTAINIHIKKKTTGRVRTMKKYSLGNHSVPFSVSVSYYSFPIYMRASGPCPKGSCVPPPSGGTKWWHQVVAQSASVGELGDSRLVSIRFFYPSARSNLSRSFNLE